MTVPHNTHVKQDCDYGSLYAVKKFTVHHAPPHMPNTLHFLDWSLRNDNNEPLVAYRIQAIENFVAHGAAQHTTQFVPLGEKSSVNDWLLDSHENGAKLRGKLLLAAGVAGVSSRVTGEPFKHCHGKALILLLPPSHRYSKLM